MFDISDLTIRPAGEPDREALTKLIQRKSFLHRHLGWGTALDLIGSSPFLILEKQNEILAALACPPDEDGITWLQLFAAAPGISIPRAWNKLWPHAEKTLRDLGGSGTVNALVIRPELDQLLEKAHFREICQVVVLIWENTRGVWPEVNDQISLRGMLKGDLARVCQIDRLAFEPIWRNSPSQLAIAYQEAYSASVVEVDGAVQGYQISTNNPQGGHLARLAVAPAYQSRGFATALLTDLLERFLERGILEVSVNTQAGNRSSLELYRKFGFSLMDERYPVRQFSYGDQP